MKDNNKEKKSFTLRLNDEIYKKIEKKAAEIGVSKNAYITMIIHKAVNEKWSTLIIVLLEGDKKWMKLLLTLPMGFL